MSKAERKPVPMPEAHDGDERAAPAGPNAVGQRLRRERERQHMGLRELARRVNCSASLISQIELGKATPSVGTLYAIVNELNLSLDELFFDAKAPGRVGAAGGDRGAGAPAPRAPLPSVAPEPRDEPAEAVPAEAVAGDPVVRAERRESLQFASGVRWERLAPSTDADVDFLYVVYDIGAASCPADGLMSHSGKEYGHVLRGRLGVTVGFETHELDPGDAISFDSTMPHRLFNAGDEPVHAVWFVVGRHGARITRASR